MRLRSALTTVHEFANWFSAQHIAVSLGCLLRHTLRLLADNGHHGMELAEAEARLGITIPHRHRLAIMAPTDPVHEWCEFLVLDSPYELLRLVGVNELLHAADHWNRWPPFLVAFASNGCGDYFAYDLRDPPRIIYMDPDYTVAENFEAEDKLEYESFDNWYNSQLSKRSI